MSAITSARGKTFRLLRSCLLPRDDPHREYGVFNPSVHRDSACEQTFFERLGPSSDIKEFSLFSIVFGNTCRQKDLHKATEVRHQGTANRIMSAAPSASSLATNVGRKTFIRRLKSATGERRAAL